MNPIAETLVRLNLSEPQAARYLGVPVYTVRKWIAGTRKPAASALRLIDVFQTLEALAPALHDYFLTDARDAGVRRRKKK